MTRDTRRLPDAELAVMQALWACQTPAGRSDLEGVLQSTHPMPPPPCSPCCPGWGTRALSAARRSAQRPIHPPVSQEDYLAAEPPVFGPAVRRQPVHLCQRPVQQRAHPPGAG